MYQEMKAYEQILNERGISMPTNAQLKDANKLFKSYIFFEERKNSRKLWTSCCHTETEWPLLQRVESPGIIQISWGKHNEKAICPFCGRDVTLKNIKKLGKRKNLKEYRAIIFLNEKNGKLEATAAWALKDYFDLTAEPTYMIAYNFRFSLGKAECFYRSYYEKETHCVLEGTYNPTKLVLHEPFKSAGMYSANEPYTIIGFENIEKSELKYCQYKHFHHPVTVHSDFIKYMSLYCVYPKQVEFLMKTGKREYISDILWYRRKNADLIKWEESDPCKAFGLNRQELNEYIKTNMDMDTLRAYKLLKKNKEKATWEIAKEICRVASCHLKEIGRLCKKHNIKITKLYNYINKFTGQRCHGGMVTFGYVYRVWKDYIDAAGKLGYDLTNETVLLPRMLEAKHDEATGELRRRLELEALKKKEAEYKKYKASMSKRRKKYNFSYGGMFVRIAESEQEVINEGKVLEHCVAGYASRHMTDKLTILFLRAEEDPNTPLVTIEMQGNRLMQAHGFRNERGGKEAPTETYKEFFNTWLAWVEAGSKRDKEGNPKIKIKREVAA